MKNVVSCIEELRIKLEKCRKAEMKETPTRTIFIDPMLQALGWDVKDLDEVALEYPTIDGKSVDYALEINRKPVVFVEAKPLGDPLTNVKDITQVVGYAASAGVEWCILTNGLTYRVYRSTEKAEAPEKLLFEVSIEQDKSIQEIAEQLMRFSKDAIAQGVLDEMGEQVFTKGKVKKALEKLLLEPPTKLVNILKEHIEDKSLKNEQIKSALKSIGAQLTQLEISTQTKIKTKEVEKSKIEQKPAIKIRGKKVRSFTFLGSKYEVNTWRELLIKFSEIIYAKHKEDFHKLLNLKRGKFSTYRFPTFFSKDKKALKYPLRIDESTFFVDGALYPNGIVHVCRKILELFGYSQDELQIEVE
ncbi:MAG: type I restriction endonuclease [Candidatus Bathyarchaeia archaeon]